MTAWVSGSCRHSSSGCLALVGADYVDAGTLSLLLLPRIEECDALLLLDAAQLDAEPGAVQVFEGPAMDGFLAASRCSVHEVGMRDLLDAARLTGCLPGRRVLVGVQPERVGWGEALSAPVESAIPAADRARARSWNAGSAPCPSEFRLRRRRFGSYVQSRVADLLQAGRSE